MEKPSFKLVGAPCGQHGQYTFYKALKVTGPHERVIAIGDFFFVKIWQDSELISIGELQLLWTDRVSDQTLVSLRLYFLPENTPDGRGSHGEHEVLAINEKVVLKAQDLLSWISDGSSWRWGLKAVWKGACVPPANNGPNTMPLHTTNLDFSDVEKEKTSVECTRGVVVFSYSRYCRYRAVLARLADIECAWLRDSLVAALGGYAASAPLTDILYCRDTFEYPELEGHELICNQLAPKLKGRAVGRRRRQRSRSRTNSSSESDAPQSKVPAVDVKTPRRLSLRNGGGEIKNSDDDEKRFKLDKKSLLGTKKCQYEDKKSPFEDKKSPFEDKKSPFEDKKPPLHVKKSSVDKLSVLDDKKSSLDDKKFLLDKIQAFDGKKSPLEDDRFILDSKKMVESDAEKAFLKKLKNFYAKRGLSFSYNSSVSLLSVYTCVSTLGGHAGVSRSRGWPVLTKFYKSEQDLRGIYERYLLSYEQHERRNGTAKPQNDENSLPDKRLRTPTPPDQTDQNSTIDNETGETKDDITIISKPAEELNREFLDSLPKEDKPIKISVKPVEKLIEPSVSKLSDNSEISDVKTNSDSAAVIPSTVPVPVASRKGSSLRAVRVKPGRNPRSNTSPPAPRPEPVLPRAQDDDIVEVPYKPKTPEIIDLDSYPETECRVTPAPPPVPQTAPPSWWSLLPPPTIPTPLHLYPHLLPPTLPLPAPPPAVAQASSIFGSAKPEKIVYGNPKDPFMPPPHLLHGTPIKPNRSVTTSTQDRHVLDLTCKPAAPLHKPQVEIVRVPPPTPQTSAPHDLSRTSIVNPKTLIPSNLEITLVSPKTKSRQPQKRSANGKFMSSTPPKPATPNYPRDDVSPSGSTSSRDSQNKDNPTLVMDVVGGLRSRNLSSMMDLHSSPLVQPAYVNALYAELAEQIEARQRLLCRRLFRPDGT